MEGGDKNGRGLDGRSLDNNIIRCEQLELVREAYASVVELDDSSARLGGVVQENTNIALPRSSEHCLCDRARQLWAVDELGQPLGPVVFGDTLMYAKFQL